MIKLLLSRVPRLLRAYNRINIVISTHYIKPVKPLEYISISYVVDRDIEAYKFPDDKKIEP